MSAHFSRSESKTQCGVKASIAVWLGILTKPGMQRFEVKKFSRCLNLGTLLLWFLQFPKHSAHHSFRGEAGKEEKEGTLALSFPSSQPCLCLQANLEEMLAVRCEVRLDGQSETTVPVSSAEHRASCLTA